jgi:EAL domain-containing protein (putative c-di-GMP-specific phosphodiesterase class I)
MVTLCEGVETKEQFDFLRSIGCQRAQGYYFSKPLPLEQLKESGKWGI